jgi:3-hydroxymyristoyl/3-hydroxydecanoyl-(acyl carrier protein) dehydratase
VKAAITLAADSPYFAGHFPGRPILPGVVALALMAEAAARITARDAPVHTIPFARLRHVVVPGDRLEIAAHRDTGGCIRVALLRGETTVANAAFELGTLQPAAASAPETTIVLPPADAPPPERLLPQQPPMRFLTAIAGEMPDGLVGTARLPAECPLAGGGGAPALATIEAAAQAAAAWEALQRWRAGGGAAPRTGYLVAVRDAVLFAAEVPVDTDLAVSVRLTAAAPPLTHYSVEVDHGPRRVLRGTIATVLTGRAGE